MSQSAAALQEPDGAAVVAALVERARAAQARFAAADQALVDDAVRALAWALYRPENAQELAALAVADTGLGNVADKVVKNQRKTFGTLRDLLRVRTVGVIEEDPAQGIVKYAKPVGVVGAITPSTNPAATPVNKAMMALKGRNAIVIAPSPAGWRTTARAVELMRAGLARVGLPEDLVQILPQPVDRARTQALMQAVDLVVCTGSQTNVREAYRSGTAGDRGRRRQRPGDRRGQRRSGRRRGQDRALQMLRQRDLMLVRERAGGGGCGLRRDAGGAGAGGRAIAARPRSARGCRRRCSRAAGSIGR